MSKKNILIEHASCQALVPFFLQTLLLIILSCALSACSDEADKSQEKASASQDTSSEWAVVNLPDITRQPLTLRVANVVNPRFKKLSSDQLARILKRSQQLVKQNFNVDINFSEVDTLDIDDVFKSLKSKVINERSDEIVNVDFINGKVREAMQQAIFKTLENYSSDKNDVIKYAQPFLLHPEIKQTDFIGLSYALTDTLIARLEYWKNEKAADGQPVLDFEGYNQWVWWDSLGYGELPYEVVITNQLVVSAEHYGMDVHSSLRGGITAGTTTYNPDALLSTYVYIMLYPMLNDTEVLTELRQDKTYSEEQIINYSAALLTHELGHMLLHLGHPFGNKSCIMSPTTMLNYRDWYDNLDSDKCRIGSSKQMTPGAVKIDYNRTW